MKRLVICLSVALLATATATAPAARRQSLARFMSISGYAAIPLTKLPTGHETVVVALNGVASTFVLDSGAGATVLHRTSLAKFGLADGDRMRSSTGVGAGGAIGIDTYAVTSLSISGRQVPLAAIRVADLTAVVGALKAAAGVEVDGVIGQDVLTRWDGVIDVAHSTLYLRLP